MLAEWQGKKLITIIGSRMDPTDISGLPSPRDREVCGRMTTITDLSIPWWQAESLEKQDVIFFLDEFSNSPAAVQASMLSFIQDREFGNGQKLPDATWIIAAMNPAGSAADFTELSSPTTNRIFFLPWDWAELVPGWMDGMLVNFGRPFLNEHEQRWKERVVSFLKTTKGRLYIHDMKTPGASPKAYGVTTEAGEDVFHKAWPSMRSWDNVTKIAACMPQDNIVAIEKVFQGTVGFIPARHFFEYLATDSKLPDVDEVLCNPGIVDWKTVSVDRSHLLLNSAIETAGRSRDKADKVAQLLMHIAATGRQDIGAPYVQRVVSMIPQTHMDVIRALAQSYRDMSDKIN
jgi:hypothetical protein